ncbi:MAG: hypothetical protein HQK65_02620 [Desulfamplus sp.]|nr:hypothetical protein [Desulfamplus sp.]
MEYGCHFEGLRDAKATIVDSNKINVEHNSIIPSTVILPNNKSQVFLTGRESHYSRICRGFSWPIESRFSPETGIRRVPISLVWQLFVASKDKKVSWRSAENYHISLSDIIAEHIMQYLPKVNDSDIVLAIPNTLHEYGQDALLASLRKRGCRPTLLWRPMAAAIDWCSNLAQPEINRMEKDDDFYFIHLGADMFEFVRLRIRKVERDGEYYAVPIRSTPSVNIPLISGSLIIASIAEQIANQYYKNSDINLIWQIYTSLSRIWTMDILEYEEHSKKPWKNDNSKETFLNFNNTWEEVSDDIFSSKIDKASLRMPHWLFKTIEECSKIDLLKALGDSESFDSNQLVFSNLSQWLQSQIKALISNCDDDEPAGAIISGDFRKFKVNDSQTMEDIVIKTLNDKISLGYQKNNSVAAATYIYSPDLKQGQIAQGCLLYGIKKAKKLPTYYDVLPKLDIRVWNKENNSYTWRTIVSTDEIEGGENYFHKFPQKFYADVNKESIDFILRRDDASECRTLPFSFPVPLSEKIYIELSVSMKPAQGFASVELIPDKPELFGKRQLFLDWQKMEPSECPSDTFEVDDIKFNNAKIGYGYPEITILKADFQLILDNEHIFFKYESTLPSSKGYLQLLVQMKNAVKSRKLINYKSYGLIDSNGNFPSPQPHHSINTLFSQADYLSLMARVIKKLNQEIDFAYRNINDKNLLIEDLIQIGSFFFVKAPDKCRQYLRGCLKRENTSVSHIYIHSISRCFHSRPEIELFFKTAIERLRQDPDKTNNWILAINKILMFRENAPEALSREDALFLAIFTRDKMKEKLMEKNIRMIFKNAANLFLYLLRWRTVNKFLQPEIPDEYCIAEEVKDILTKSLKYTQNKNTQKILDQLVKYIDYRGEYLIQGFIDELK